MPVELWSSAAFRDEVATWVAAVAADAGVRVLGPAEQPHCRPWSSTMRFETDAGVWWFKVNGPGTLHEGSLVAALARLEPGLVPDVLAVDAGRGWWLTRDAGPVLRSQATPEELWSSWEALLPRYAEAQLRLAGHVGELLGTGLPEASPATLPTQASELIKDLAALDPDVGGLTRRDHDALEALLPAYTGWCAEVDAAGIPLSIQHDDLHSSNICWPGWPASMERARIIDWGDASVGHPLGTMLCTLNSIAWHAKTELDDPRVERVRDAYLEPFTSYADRPRLVALVGTVRRVGCVTRALSYRQAFAGEPPSAEAEEDFPVRGWLLELLEEGT